MTDVLDQPPLWMCSLDVGPVLVGGVDVERLVGLAVPGDAPIDQAPAEQGQREPAEVPRRRPWATSKVPPMADAQRSTSPTLIVAGRMVGLLVLADPLDRESGASCRLLIEVMSPW